MEFVQTRDQIVENLRTFESYRRSPDPQVRQYYAGILRRGRQLVGGRIDGAYAFAPSRFVGYKGCTRLRHEADPYKHGTRTTNAINSILGKSAADRTLESRYTRLCASVGVTPYNFPRAFWRLGGELDGVSSEALEAEQVLRSRGTTGKGQGFGLSPTERKAVEAHAMARAIEFFRRQWDTVDDVSGRLSYDLLCSCGDTRLRVEVKGTITSGSEIILTRNEVEEARTEGYALFVVSEIQIDRFGDVIGAHGGLARLYHPWSPEAGGLRPISYQCSLVLLDGTVVEF